MMHHPGEEFLLAYAAGNSSEAVSLVVAGHLAFCAQCRQMVASLEAAGGALLGNLEPAALADGALDRVLTQLGAQAANPAVKPAVKSDVPAPLRPYIGMDMAQIRWRPLAPGISYLPLFAREGARARLIRAAAGVGVAQHTHRGTEMTLVLAGGFTDETGQYGAGDVQTTTSDILHAPVADADGPCISLGVTEAPLLFSGLLPKLIGKLAGF